MTTQTTLDYLGCLPANFMPGVSLPGLRSLREDKQGVKGVAAPLSLGPSLSLGSLPANEHIVGQGHDGHECAHDSDHGKEDLHEFALSPKLSSKNNPTTHGGCQRDGAFSAPLSTRTDETCPPLRLQIGGQADQDPVLLTVVLQLNCRLRLTLAIQLNPGNTTLTTIRVFYRDRIHRTPVPVAHFYLRPIAR